MFLTSLVAPRVGALILLFGGTVRTVTTAAKNVARPAMLWRRTKSPSRRTRLIICRFVTTGPATIPRAWRATALWAWMLVKTFELRCFAFSCVVNTPVIYLMVIFPCNPTDLENFLCSCDALALSLRAASLLGIRDAPSIWGGDSLER